MEVVFFASSKSCIPTLQPSDMRLKAKQKFYNGWQSMYRDCRWEQEAGRKGRRERCVVALIWSVILVSANQGLPVLGGAWFHLPEHPTQHTYSRDTWTHAHWLSENNTHPPTHTQTHLILTLHFCFSVSAPSLWPNICLLGSTYAETGHKISWKELRASESGAFSTLGGDLPYAQSHVRLP